MNAKEIRNSAHCGKRGKNWLWRGRMFLFLQFSVVSDVLLQEKLKNPERMEGRIKVLPEELQQGWRSRDGSHMLLDCNINLTPTWWTNIPHSWNTVLYSSCSRNMYTAKREVIWKNRWRPASSTSKTCCVVFYIKWEVGNLNYRMETFWRKVCGIRSYDFLWKITKQRWAQRPFLKVKGNKPSF